MTTQENMFRMARAIATRFDAAVAERRRELPWWIRIFLPRISK